MGWNGSGTFTRSYDWTNERDAGYKIDAAKFDTENENFTTGINACITKNGENAATGNLPMGGYKHTGAADGTAINHYATVGQIQNGSAAWAGTSGGSANAQTVTLSPAPSAYTTGMQVAFLAGLANTATCTINVNSLGAKNIRSNSQLLGGSEIQVGGIYQIVYDGTSFILVTPGSSLMPAAKAYLDVDSTVASGGYVGVTFDAVDYEYPASMWDVGDPEFIVVPVRGIYHIEAHVVMSGAAMTGDEFIVRVVKYPGPSNIGDAGMSVLDSTSISASVGVDYKAAAADKFGILIYQNSGSTWTLTGGSAIAPKTSIAVHMVRGY